MIQHVAADVFGTFVLFSFHVRQQSYSTYTVQYRQRHMNRRGIEVTNMTENQL